MENNMLFVVNPVSAARATSKEWPLFEKQLIDMGYKFDVKHTEYPEHAVQITREALKNGYSLIVSVGGDGTMNEVVNGFFEEGIQLNPEAKLAIFSRGTGCDFIKSIGIRKGFEDFVELLKRNSIKKLDIGKVKFLDANNRHGDKYFLNIADIGLGGDTCNRVNIVSKMLKGFLAFMIGALTSILFYKNKVFYVNIDDRTVLDEKLNSIIVSNGKYFGGGMKIAPNAELHDGYFDIITLGNLNKLELFYNFKLIYKGEHLKHPKVKQYKGKKITVQCKTNAFIEIDGEQMGTGDVQFEIIPVALNVLV